MSSAQMAYEKRKARLAKEKDDEGEFDSWSWEVHVIESGGGEVEEAGHKVEL